MVFAPASGPSESSKHRAVPAINYRIFKFSIRSKTSHATSPCVSGRRDSRLFKADEVRIPPSLKYGSHRRRACRCACRLLCGRAVGPHRPSHRRPPVQRSWPSNARVMSNAVARRPGPRARSCTRTPGRCRDMRVMPSSGDSRAPQQHAGAGASTASADIEREPAAVDETNIGVAALEEQRGIAGGLALVGMAARTPAATTARPPGPTVTSW